MIDLKHAQEQLNRMRNLNFGPRANQERAEVLRVMQAARTFLVLDAAVSSWIDNQAEFPKPAEIRSIIASLNEAHDQAVYSARRVCIACGGSGWVPTRGMNHFDGSEVSGAKACLCRSIGQPVVSDGDTCSTCRGFGVYGGQIGTGKFDGPWKWCACEVGIDRRNREPELVAESNTARQKIIRKFGPKALPGMLQQLADEDQYHGEF